MGRSYTLRESIDRDTLLRVMKAAAKELGLDFSTYRPAREPRYSGNNGVLLQRISESSGLRAIFSRLLPKIKFSFTALLLSDRVDSLDFLLFDGDPIEFGGEGQRNTLMDENQPEYTSAKSLLNSYMSEVYGRLNELHNESRHNNPQNL